ncbi:hypothetical protein HDU83_004021 [Entophlyctis luteolus]|nr:hypothetical protein HDU83_004021 [Entophlyctis luteolus]
MSVNLVSFGEVLDTESLFESFKQVALQNMAVEECLFWEAYKDLEALAERVERHRRSTNHTRFSASLHHPQVHPMQLKRKTSSVYTKRISRLANTPSSGTGSGRCSAASNCDAKPGILRISTRSHSEGTGGGQISAPIGPNLSVASKHALESDSDVMNTSLVKRFNRIYLRFIATNAEYQVNISGVNRIILDKMYACGKWKMNAFEEAKKEVVTSMVTRIFVAGNLLTAI